MSESQPNGRLPDPAEVDVLGDGWDARVRGEPHSGLAHGDLAVIRTLERLAGAPSPHARFAASLRSSLMKSYRTPITASPAASAGRLSDLQRRIAGRSLRMGWRFGSGAVTAALLLVTLAGVVFTLTQSGRPPAATSTAQAPAAQTPAIDDRWTCERPDPFIPCQLALQSLARVTLPIDASYAAVLSAHRAQLQDWRIAPGGDVADAPRAETTGVVVDFVLEGAYAATFDTEVTVYRHGIRNSGVAQRADTGTIVELGAGDAVAYQPGRLRSLANPLGVMELRFMRAVISDDARAFIPTSAASPTPGNLTVKRVIGGNGWLTTVEASATLAEPLSTVWQFELDFELAYVSIPDGATFPPERAEPYVAIGPVAPKPSESLQTQGFVLFITATKG